MRLFRRPCVVLLVFSTLTGSPRAATLDAAQMPSVPPTNAPAPPSTAPPRAAPSQVLAPQTRLPLDVQAPLIGVWEGSNDLKDLRVRETTQVEFRPDGVAVARFVSAGPVQQRREPVVSTYRYTILGIAKGVITVDFEYVGADDEVDVDDRRRRVNFTIEAGRVLRSDDGSALVRIH